MTASRGHKETAGWRRFLRVVVVVIVVLELVYVAAGNLLLNSQWFHDAVNVRPERVLIEWQSARTLFPGHLAGTGVTLRTHSPRVQSISEADSFSGWLSPVALLSRTVRITFAHIDNLTTLVRSARMLREAEPGELPFFPRIPGLEPLMPDMPPAFGPFRPGWTIDIDDITVTGEQHLALGNYDIHAQGRLDGALSYRVRDRLQIDGIDATLDSVRVHLNDEDLIREGSASGHVSVAPFIPYFQPGMSKLAFASVDAAIDGELASLEVLNFYLGVEKREKWPGLSAEGRLSGRLVVVEGRLDPATDLAVDADLISFETENLALQSAGMIRLQPAAGDDAKRLMSFELADLRLRHRTDEKTLIETRGLTFYLNSEDVTIGTPFREIRVRADIARSAVPDLTVFNRFIPSKIPLAFTQGAGDIVGDVTWEGGRMRGDVKLDADGVKLTLKQHAMTASFNMNLALAANPEERTVSIGGTRLSISDARMDADDQDLQPWSGQVRIETARVRFREGVRETIKPGRALSQLVDFADGELKLSGSISNIDFLDHLLTDERRLTFTGDGKFSAHLQMRQGAIRAGSTATFESANLSARFLDFRTHGAGRLQAAFHEEHENRILDVRALLEQVALVREGEDAPFVQAPQVVFRVDGRAPDVTEPLRDIAINLQIDEALVPDITVYNTYLPENSVLRLLSGSGVIRSRFTLDDDQAQGRFTLVATDVGAVVNARELAVDLDMDINLSDGDLDTRRFDVGGSRLRVSNVHYPDGRSLEDWSTVFSFTNGELQWTRPISLSADTRLEMTSSGPLVELLAGSYGQLRWVQDLLSVNNVTGGGRLVINPDAVILNDLDIRGEEIEIAANLRIDNEGPEGIIFNRYGLLKATVSFDGSERDWHILSAREHFERHPGY